MALQASTNTMMAAGARTAATSTTTTATTTTLEGVTVDQVLHALSHMQLQYEAGCQQAAQAEARIQRMNHELASIKQELVAYEAARDSAVSMAAKHHVAQQEYQHERAFWQQRCAAAHKRMSVAAAQSQQCNNERRDVVRGFANYASDRQQVATSAHQRAVAAVAMHSQQADGEARSLSTQIQARKRHIAELQRATDATTAAEARDSGSASATKGQHASPSRLRRLALERAQLEASIKQLTAQLSSCSQSQKEMGSLIAALEQRIPVLQHRARRLAHRLYGIEHGDSKLASDHHPVEEAPGTPAGRVGRNTASPVLDRVGESPPRFAATTTSAPAQGSSAHSHVARSHRHTTRGRRSSTAAESLFSY